jgi:hypothetical protein
LAVLFVVAGANLARADALSTVTEALMDAEGQQGTLIARVFGADPTNTLQFSSNIDTSSYDFSFQSLPNQYYQGQQFAMSVTGTYDATMGSWSLSSSTTVDGTTFAGIGALDIDAAGNEFDPDHTQSDWNWQIGPLKLDQHTKVDFASLDGIDVSSTEIKFTINDVVIAEGLGIDAMGSEKWEWELPFFPGFKFTVDSTGPLASAGGGPGSFQMQIVPEPRSELLATSALAALFAVGAFGSQHRRHRKPESSSAA